MLGHQQQSGFSRVDELIDNGRCGQRRVSSHLKTGNIIDGHMVLYTSTGHVDQLTDGMIATHLCTDQDFGPPLEHELHLLSRRPRHAAGMSIGPLGCSGDNIVSLGLGVTLGESRLSETPLTDRR